MFLKTTSQKKRTYSLYINSNKTQNDRYWNAKDLTIGRKFVEQTGCTHQSGICRLQIYREE
jgi:hypothetical protein